MVQDQLHTFHPNCRFVQALLDHEVEFLVVGGLAVCFHDCRDPIDVDDLDLMVSHRRSNAEKLIATLPGLGLNTRWSVQEFSKPNIHLPIKNGFYLDVLTAPDDIDFEALRNRSLPAQLDDTPVHVVSRKDLIALKRIAVTRIEQDIAMHPKDLQRLAALERDMAKLRRDLECLTAE